jgi:hypothetical protein
MIRWMPAARAFCARRWIRNFDLLAGGHHQVGELVDDHDDLRQDSISSSSVS